MQAETLTVVRPNGRRATAALSIAIAAVWIAFVARGVPLLRHDWFPIVPSLHFAVDNVTGWDPTGMGAAIGYPASFLMIFARSALASALGSYATHLLFFALCGLLLVFGAARLARQLDASLPAQLAAAAFAAFNPWTFTQLVAGHTLMLLSYAATFWLVAECCARNRSEGRLIPLALVIAPQLQFLMVDSLLYAWLALRMRSWRSFAAIAAMMLPVAVGVVVSRSVLLGMPLTLEWERSQSLWPLQAVILRGYFAHYDADFGAFFEAACWSVFALAFLGVTLIALGRRRELWLIPFAAIPLVWSFGSRGPFHDLFAWALVHVPEVALFRELYDLLGFVAIGYVAFCAVAAARFRPLGWVWLVAASAMFAAWCLSPPERFWVPAQRLPLAHVAQPPNSRFALMPALFPARFEGRGSGTDPELYARDDDVNPVNEAFPLYPVSSAVGSFLRDGSARRFAALSVSEIYARPWLATDPSIRYQFALPPPAWLFRTLRAPLVVADPTPELSLGALPDVGTLTSNLGAGNVLFGDARDAAGTAFPAGWRGFASPLRVRAASAFVDAAEGWVDARLAFVEQPELGQPYGGALTTNAAALLPVTSGLDTLVWVRGRLATPAGVTVAGDTAGYRWIRLPPEVHAVRCAGRCVVAAQAVLPPGLPLDPSAKAHTSVTFSAPVPWLVTATLPPGVAALLRYNVTFDAKWIALYASRTLPHVRIDGVVNGWLVPARSRATSALLLETGAVAVACSEVVATLAIGLLLGSVALAPYRERSRTRSARARAIRLADGADR